MNNTLGYLEVYRMKKRKNKTRPRFTIVRGEQAVFVEIWDSMFSRVSYFQLTTREARNLARKLAKV